jgi:Mrp family chromosome partitioning ATPase
LELEYVARAVRRFWPIVIVSVVLGAVLGLVVRPNATPRYESAALMRVTPSSNSGDLGGDRYISSELVVLESPPIAERARQIAALPQNAVTPAVSFAQLPGTDVVRIIASSSSAEYAQVYANAYLEAYREHARAAATENQADATELAESLAEIERQLNDVSAQIEGVLEPYIEAAGAEGGAQIPAVEVVAPILNARKEVLVEQYRDLLTRSTAAQFNPVNSGGEIIQAAERPTIPTVESSRLFVLAVPVAMALLGIVVATVLARASRRVLDGMEVTQLLGVPFASVVPHDRALAGGSLADLPLRSDETTEVINELTVQAEAQNSAGSALTVLVAGSQRLAGTTTLSAAIATRFGEQGLRVALVDLDFEKPEISEFFGVQGDGFAAMLTLLPPEASKWGEDERRSNVFVPTPVDNVSVVGRSPHIDAARPQRADLLVAFDTAVLYADVVVFDAGPTLGSPASAVLSQHADAVVLAVPVRAQDRSALRLVARQLASVRSHLLPVAMPRLTWARPWRSRHRSSAVAIDDTGVEPRVNSLDPDTAMR